MSETFIHETGVVDPGANIGAGTVGPPVVLAVSGNRVGFVALWHPLLSPSYRPSLARLSRAPPLLWRL